MAPGGGADEAGQTFTFVISNNNNPLFSVQPAVSPAGTLTYTLAANAFGVATVTVAVKDNGGTLNGGVDTSTPADTFSITVTGVNDAPSYTKGANQSVLEDAAAQTVVGWGDRHQRRAERGQSGRELHGHQQHQHRALQRRARGLGRRHPYLHPRRRCQRRGHHQPPPR